MQTTDESASAPARSVRAAASLRQRAPEDSRRPRPGGARRARRAAPSATTPSSSRPSWAPPRTTSRAPPSSAFPPPPLKNTIRVGGGDAAADAAGVASAIFPGTSAPTRPTAVVLVDERRLAGRRVRGGAGRQPDRRAAAGLRRRRPLPGDRRHAQAPEAQGLRPLARTPRSSGSARSPPRPEGYKTAVIQGQRPVRAGGGHRPLLLGRKGQALAQRGGGLRRAGGLRDAGRRLGRALRRHACCSPAATPSRPPPGGRCGRTTSPTSSCWARSAWSRRRSSGRCGGSGGCAGSRAPTR